MKKNNLIILGVCLIFAAIVLGLIVYFGRSNSSSDISSASDMKKMIKTVYSNTSVELPSLDTQEIDVKNKDDVTLYTGLKSNENVETLVVSVPLMNAQAYSLSVVKVKDGANIEEMKQEMLDNINMRRWICVGAEKLYITNNGNVIFLVMASEEEAKAVYDEFKKYVNNNIGKELVKTESDSDIVLPSQVVD